MPPSTSAHHAALVTGASRGIGLALVHHLAAHRHNVILVARHADALESLALEIRQTYNVHAWPIPADLARRAAPDELFAQVEQSNLNVDLLINNAGFGIFGAFVDTKLGDDLELLEVNLLALTQLTKLFARPMVSRGQGRIINVASTGAFQPGPLMATYYASKAYVLSLSEALAAELSGTGVTVTALCPGVTRSDFPQRAGMQHARILHLPFLTMSAETVARVAYRGAMRGKPVVIPGLINRLLAFSTRFAPRALVARIVHWLMQHR